MKKIIIIIFSCLLLVGCQKDNKVDMIDYTKGTIISKTDNEIKINNTTEEDLQNYIMSLQTITYTYINNFTNNNPYYLTNGDKYIKLEYIPVDSEKYNGYNVIINIYSKYEELN